MTMQKVSALALLGCVVADGTSSSGAWNHQLCRTKARLTFSDGLTFPLNLFTGGGSASKWAVVCVHGHSRKQTASWWSPLHSKLANTTSVVAIDMPGHGDTVMPVGLESRMSGAAHVSALESVLRRAVTGSLSAPRPGADCLASNGSITASTSI